MTDMDPKRLLVFLSYASEDRKQVRNLCKRLRDDGFDPWLDEERLLPGQDWNLEIEKALRASDAILLCFSALSVAKEGYIQREYKRAMRYLEEKPEGTIFVIPVRLDDCDLPHFIQEIQWVDYPDDYDRLILALQSKSGKLAITKANLKNKRTKQVQIVLDGDFKTFNQAKQQDLIGVLAAILHVDVDKIQILRVYQGSIIIILEMPDTTAYQLDKIATKGDFRLRAEKILSIQVEGRELVTLSETRKTTSSPRPCSGNVFNVEGGIHVGRDYVAGNQNNVYYQNQQTFNITSPSQFMDELQKLKVEIERLKSQPDVDKSAARRIDVVQADIDDALEEAAKEQPAAERINKTLDSAKETMDKLGGSVTSAINLGTALGNLAMIAMKVFGG